MYEQKDDLNGDWQDVPITSTSGEILVNYKKEVNKFIIEELQPEREHRVILDCTFKGKTGRFVYEFSTKSGIAIEFAVTPLNGSSSLTYTFQVNKLSSFLNLYEYEWYMSTADDFKLIGATTQDLYQNFIGLFGTAAENNIVEIILIVTNVQNGAKREYTQKVINVKGAWVLTDLDKVLT